LSNSQPKAKSGNSTQIFGVGSPQTPLTREDHAFIFQNLWKVFVEPKFTAQSFMSVYPKITYRKLNHWEETGLISPFRKTEKTGWRKLSFLNVVQLVLIEQLKEIGLSTERIKKTIDYVSERRYPLYSDGEIKMSELEHSIFTSLTGQPTGLLLYDSSKARSGLLGIQIIDSILNNNGAEFHVYVPLKTAIDIALRTAGREPTDACEYPPIFDPKLVKLLRIIRNVEYQSIQLTMKNGAVQKIKGVKRIGDSVTVERIINSISNGSLKKIIVNRGKNAKEIVLTEEELIRL